MPLSAVLIFRNCSFYTKQISEMKATYPVTVLSRKNGNEMYDSRTLFIQIICYMCVCILQLNSYECYECNWDSPCFEKPFSFAFVLVLITSKQSHVQTVIHEKWRHHGFCLIWSCRDLAANHWICNAPSGIMLPGSTMDEVQRCWIRNGERGVRGMVLKYP